MFFYLWFLAVVIVVKQKIPVLCDEVITVICQKIIVGVWTV